MRVHRAKEVVKNLSGKFIFPVAERRRERALKEEDVGVLNEPPELVEMSDDEDPANPDDDAEAQALVYLGCRALTQTQIPKDILKIM